MTSEESKEFLEVLKQQACEVHKHDLISCTHGDKIHGLPESPIGIHFEVTCCSRDDCTAFLVLLRSNGLVYPEGQLYGIAFSSALEYRCGVAIGVISKVKNPAYYRNESRVVH